MSAIEVLGACPVHGRQVFRRESGQNWWACPITRMFAPDECGFVIPDESVTPDGGEVVHISRLRFAGSPERRYVASL